MHKNTEGNPKPISIIQRRAMTGRPHNPHSFVNLVRLIGLTLLTAVVYLLLKIQGKLKQ